MKKNKPLFEVSALQDDEGVYTQEFIKDLREALDDVKYGRVISHEQMKKRYGIK